MVETALALALLTCGGLLLQTFQHLLNTDLGIRTERLLTFETPLLRYQDFDRRVAFVNAELEKVRAISGVTDAGAISQTFANRNYPGRSPLGESSSSSASMRTATGTQSSES